MSWSCSVESVALHTTPCFVSVWWWCYNDGRSWLKEMFWNVRFPKS